MHNVQNNKKGYAKLADTTKKRSMTRAEHATRFSCASQGFERTLFPDIWIVRELFVFVWSGSLSGPSARQTEAQVFCWLVPSQAVYQRSQTSDADMN